MTFRTVKSIKPIDRLYSTGDRPVQVACADLHTYVCKYMEKNVRSSKLVTELLGAFLAKCWKLPMPEYAFVEIAPEHWYGCDVSHVVTAPAFGSQLLTSVDDVSSNMSFQIPIMERIVIDLLKIALFDIWTANEDRTRNNANLLYDLNQKSLVSIDYGGIFNMRSYDMSFSSLTLGDSILYADIFERVCRQMGKNTLLHIGNSLKSYYLGCVSRCNDNAMHAIAQIPSEWLYPKPDITAKMAQLMADSWIEQAWNTFIELINDAIELNEKTAV